MRRHPLIALGSIALVALLAGCGSGSSSSTTETPAGAAMAAYIAKADAFCEAENKRLHGPGARLESTLRAANKAKEPAVGATVLRKFAAQIKQGLAGFEALEPPAAERRAVAAMIATQASQIELFGQFAAALEAESRAGVQTAKTRLLRSKKTYGEETKQLGFKVCGVRSR